ncbi:hypothetical protein PENTCL1PPCAC_9924, partial [Pristionchus entomophagus]
EMDFMSRTSQFCVNQNNAFGSALILPYQNDKYNFFILMPKETSSLAKMREEITGKDLVNLLKNTEQQIQKIAVPKFDVKSLLNFQDVLKKM